MGLPVASGRSKVSLFCRGDVNGFWALFADNLANMIIVTGVCVYVLHVPPEAVFGRILPGLGVSLLLGLGFYAWLARRMCARTGRDDFTALPYGIVAGLCAMLHVTGAKVIPGAEH